MSTRNSLDSLYGQVTQKILSESLALKKGETLTIETWNNGIPFARRVAIDARKMGALTVTLLEDEEAYVEGVRGSPDDSLGKMGNHEYGLLAGTDVYVFIPGPVLGSYSHRLTRKEMLDSVRYNSSWYEAAAKARLRGARLSFG
jgi:leucyl aminopeptidase (aminopeptidase T)